MIDVESAAFSIIEDAIKSQPRTMQLSIGPSELGMECEHCLGARLVGWQKKPEASWLPFIGTAVHAALEEMFIGQEGWLTETRVCVGRIMGKEVWGTSDLFHVPSGTVVDWKIVGSTTLKSAKGGPSMTYTRQIHSYGTGFLRAGYDVNRVAIAFLPRNAISLSQAVWWEDDYKPLVALGALQRATELAERIFALPEEERDAFLSDLPRATGCYDCPRYADWGHPVPELDTLDSLLGIAA